MINVSKQSLDDLDASSLTNAQEFWNLVHVEDRKMKGKIRPISRQASCPKCGKKFLHVQKVGYGCMECKTIPNRFYIDLHWNGRRLSVCSDRQGEAIDSYQRASNLLAHLQYEIDHHTFDPSRYVSADLKKYAVSTLLDKYWEDKETTLAPSCIKDYERYIKAAKEFFKIADVREIHKTDIIGFKKFIERGYKPKGKIAKEVRKGKTVKNYVDAFKTFFFYLKNELEMISVVPPFPEVIVEEFEWKWIDAEDQIKILSNIPEGDRPIIAFLMLHGCRPGEARALKCKQVDVKHSSIKINATFSGKEVREKRKGKRSRVVIIPMHPEFHDDLAEKVQNNLPEAFIFTNPRNGNPYSESAIQRLWDSARTKAGISKDLRLYDASRHSFASQLADSDTSILTISRLLGHSSIKMTEKYAHNRISKLRADIAKLSLKGKQAEVININRKEAV